MRAVIGLFLALLVASLIDGQAAAVTATFAETSPPIEISADQGIEWERDGKVVHARGNAVATRGDVTVTGRVLSAYYRETAAGGNEIWRLTAAGDVVISRPGERATGERAVYEMDSAKVTLTGGAPNRLTGAEGQVSAEERIEYWTEERKLVAIGNAVAQDETSRIEAAVITAHLAETQEGQLELSEVEAVGNLVLTTENDVVRAEQGFYDATRRVATVSGSVQIKRGNNRLSGCRGEVDFNTGVNRLLPCNGEARSGSRVHGLIKPKTSQPAPQE